MSSTSDGEVLEVFPVLASTLGIEDATGLFLLKMADNSMRPSVWKDEWVIIDPKQSAMDGQLAAVVCEGNMTIRIRRALAEGDVWVPQNTGFMTITSRHEFTVPGRVITILRKP